MNDSERSPEGRDDERRNAEEVDRLAADRAMAEETVRIKGWTAWIVHPDHLYESELIHADHEALDAGISIWYAGEDTRSDAPPMCEVFNEESSLWVLGVPGPEEVPELLERYADFVMAYGETTAKHWVDLRTGRVLNEPEFKRLLEMPQEKRSPRDKVEAERRRLRELADGMRARYGTEEHSNEEEAEDFARQLKKFIDSTDPELLWPEGVEPPTGGLLFGVLRTPEEWAFEERVTRKDTDPPRQEPTSVEEIEEIVAERVLERELLRRKEEEFLYGELCADLAPGEKRPTPGEVRAELARRRALPEAQGDGSQDGYFVVKYDAPDERGEGAA